jgi:hypothetical protein
LPTVNRLLTGIGWTPVPVFFVPGIGLREKSTGMRGDSSQNPPFFIGGPRKFADAPTYFGGAPTKFADAPSYFGERPIKFAQAPTHFADTPSSFAHAPTKFAGASPNFAQPPINFGEWPIKFAAAPVNFTPITALTRIFHRVKYAPRPSSFWEGTWHGRPGKMDKNKVVFSFLRRG